MRSRLLVRRRLRCAIKKLRNKIISVVLVCTLVIGILVSGALAESVGQTKGIYQIFNEVFENNSYYESSLSVLLTWFNTYYEDGKNVTVGVYSSYMRVVIHDGSLWNTNNYLRSDVSSVFYSCTLDINNNIYYYSYTPNGRTTTAFGITWYNTGDFNNMNNSAVIYTTSSYYVTNSFLCSNNLIIDGPFQPDQRIFEVWKSVDYPESSNPLEYINIKLDGSVDLSRISSQKIRFDYTDQDGNNQYKVFSESDFHDIQYFDSEDYYTFYIFPYLISSYEFTITSSTYYSDTDWAEKTIELDLIFNEGTIYPLPQDWNSVYTVNQYFESQSNGRINSGVTKLAISSEVIFWVDYNQKVCQQPFGVKALFIPYFMNSDLLSINLETLFQLYEQYDVIFTGVQPAQFNVLLPSLDYNDLYVYYSQNGFYPALLKLQGVTVPYSNLRYDVDYFDYTWSLSTDDVGFLVTRSFLLKRTLSALGDIDDRLLEFESNLVGEDSLGVSLQTKLDNIFSLEHDFFTDVSNFFQKLEYNLNGLSLGRIEKYLEDIWSATVGERNFNYTDLLPEPLKSIFLYFRGWFISSTQYMQDFIDVSNSSLYGDDLMKLPFEASVVPVLPFEPGTPTPIPIPTLEAGLIEVGGD